MTNWIFRFFPPREKILEEIELSIERHKSKIEAEREALRRRAAAYQKSNPGFAYIGPIPQKFANLSSLNSGLIENLQKERDAIDGVVRDTRHHMRLASDMLDSIKGSPESSPQITYALILVTMLFFSGVVYPLSFMPADPEGNFNLSVDYFIPLLFSLKGAFLFAISLIFGVVLVIFFWLNIKLKYPRETLEQLESYTKISSYSDSFAIMDINEKLGAASRDG